METEQVREVWPKRSKGRCDGRCLAGGPNAANMGAAAGACFPDLWLAACVHAPTKPPVPAVLHASTCSSGEVTVLTSLTSWFGPSQIVTHHSKDRNNWLVGVSCCC